MGLSVFLFFDVPTSEFKILASLNSLLQSLFKYLAALPAFVGCRSGGIK
jgi:hypothetical protein